MIRSEKFGICDKNASSSLSVYKMLEGEIAGLDVFGSSLGKGRAYTFTPCRGEQRGSYQKRQDNKPGIDTGRRHPALLHGFGADRRL
jgi:hypothetical protein